LTVDLQRNDQLVAAFDPSQPLADRKRERFCQELAAGTPLYRSYELAGFRRPRGNAYRLEREEKVRARLGHLRTEVEKYEPVFLAFRRTMMRHQLEAIIDCDRLGYFEEYVSDGKRRLRLKGIDQLTAEQRAVIDAIEVTDNGVKVSLPSRLQALAALARIDGLDGSVNEAVAVQVNRIERVIVAAQVAGEASAVEREYPGLHPRIAALLRPKGDGNV
jgi:hypothetical protein